MPGNGLGRGMEALYRVLLKWRRKARQADTNKIKRVLGLELRSERVGVRQQKTFKAELGHECSG